MTAIKDLMLETFEVSKVLIIAPLRVARDTWPAEIEKWDHLQGLDISVIVGDTKTRIAALHHPAMIYAAAFRIRDSKAQIVVRQHCLDRIPLKAVEFENGKHMGKTAVFYHKKIGLQQFSEELFSSKEQMRQLEKKFCKN